MTTGAAAAYESTPSPARVIEKDGLALLMRQPVGSDPASAMAWVPYLEKAGMAREADALLRAAVVDYLTEPSRGTLEVPVRTLAQVIERGHSLPQPQGDARLQHALAQLMDRQLQLQPLQASPPAAPSSSGQVTASHQLHNAGPLPLALNHFIAYQRGHTGAIVPLRCTRPGLAVMALIAANSRTPVACSAGDAEVSAIKPRLLREGQTLRPEGGPKFLPTADGQAYDFRLMALILAATARGEVRDFQTAHPPCSVQNSCAPAMAATAPEAAPAATATTAATPVATSAAPPVAATPAAIKPSKPAEPTTRAATPRRESKLFRQIKGLFLIALIFPAYALVAWVTGTRVATGLTTVLAAGAGLSLFGSFGTGAAAQGGLGASMMILMAVAVVVAGAAGYLAATVMARFHNKLFGASRRVVPTKARAGALAPSR